MSMIGKTLGTFECTALLGKGGMGEVYKAKDQKLGRDVAIKVLPEEFAKDADRVARFQREAKLLASLNHPNIAAIHGLEESDGIHFLVLELIEGDTLADRLKRGAIPVEESLKLALQIAEALEAAHEKGVIHRDLKPANIKVTPDGKVKVLDFGLAKAFAGDQAEVNLSHSPTLSEAATLQGVILGTAAYMSPEQARGKPVDKRTDIWAFGCVLYEMLTGQAAFQGEDVTEILAAVVKSGVNLDLLPANIHPRVREVITRCLQKEQKRRYSCIDDAQYEIEQVLADPRGVFAQPSVTTKPKKKLRLGLPWIATVFVLGGIIFGIAVWMLRPTQPRQVIYFDHDLPEDQEFTDFAMKSVAVSADGSKIVYVANRKLYLKYSNELAARPIQGADENPLNPFFSPDGQWVGYFTQGQLKKIEISGGAPVKLCSASDPFGATWGTDGTIVFAQADTGVMSIPVSGGTPKTLVEAEEGEVIFGPSLLPDGEWLLFTVTKYAGPARWDEAQIVVQSLESGERKTIVAGGSDARYVPTGYLIYALGDDLLAVGFDVNSLERTGQTVSIIEGTKRARYPVVGSGTANYDFSESGMMVYIPGSNPQTSRRILVWVDRNGKEEPLELPPDSYRTPRISPDGNMVAMTIASGEGSDIWIRDLVRKSMNKLTLDEANDSYPLWTPDGERIVFWSDRAEGGIYWKAANGTGEAEMLIEGEGRNMFPASWADNGNALVFESISLQSGYSDPAIDIGLMSMEGDYKSKLLITGRFYETNPNVSLDSRWIAYLSNESGQFEIFVRPYPEVDKERKIISTNTGQEPRWSPDGRELFYRGGDSMMVVKVETDPIFKASIPESVFQDIYFSEIGHQWDLAPDGKRFLMIKGSEGDVIADEILRPRINFIVNWFEELKDRVPVD